MVIVCERPVNCSVTGLAVAVAASDNSISGLPKKSVPIAVIVAPSGIPGPETVIPRPSCAVEVTETNAEPLNVAAPASDRIVLGTGRFAIDVPMLLSRSEAQVFDTTPSCDSAVPSAATPLLVSNPK